MQTNVIVNNSSRTMSGTLKYLSSGSLVDTFGAGNFIALKFNNIPEDATSVKVGLDPSEGTGLVEIINDPDKNGAFKITDKNTQKFVVQVTTPDGVNTIEYSLSALNCLSDIPTITDITNQLSQQLNLFRQRLDGSIINPNLYDPITSEEDAYYKTNDEYKDAVDEFESTMDGTD